DGESERDETPRAPPLYNFCAEAIRFVDVAGENGAGEPKTQGHIWRHGFFVSSEHRADGFSADAAALGHGHGQLRARPGIFSHGRGDIGGKPGIGGNILAVTGNFGNPGKEEEGPRAGVEDVTRVTGVVVEGALEGADLPFEEPPNHFTTPFSKRTLAT